jgi:phosphoglycolate phosphatase
VVTSNSHENVRRLLGDRATARLFQVSAGTALFGKARRFRRLVRESGVPKEEVICVGDELRDLDAARAEGLCAAAVAWGYASRAAIEAHRPDALFESVEQLSQFLTSSP